MNKEALGWRIGYLNKEQCAPQTKWELYTFKQLAEIAEDDE